MKTASKRTWFTLGTVVYIIFLIKVILLKGFFFFRVVPASRYYKQHMKSGTYHGHNFIPFRTIRMFLFEDLSFRSSFYNLAGNVLLFVPFGFLLSFALLNRARFATVLACTFLLSSFFELYQLLSHTGQCDIDDIILNTTGGMIGFLLFRLAESTFFRQRATAVSRSSISQLPR